MGREVGLEDPSTPFELWLRGARSFLGRELVLEATVLLLAILGSSDIELGGFLGFRA